MDSCGCDDYASPIDDEIAREDRERYHAEGPDETTAMLLDMIDELDIRGATVLDIGGGIGVIDQELLNRGASSAVLVEASTPYLAVARSEVDEAGLGDRLRVVAGDFVRRAERIEPADIVTMDRVICCYPDVDELVALSATRATRLYGLVLPRDGWWVRLATRLENVWHWLRRSSYRAFAHSNRRIDAQLASAGLRVRAESFTRWWRVVLFARDGTSRPTE